MACTTGQRQRRRTILTLMPALWSLGGAADLDCALGSSRQPSAPARVSTPLAPAALAQQLLRDPPPCPTLFAGPGLAATHAVRRWTVAHLRMAVGQLDVTWDESTNGIFTYWDNTTVLAGRSATPKHRKLRGRAEQFFRRLEAPAATEPERLAAVRFGGKLRRWAPPLVDEVHEYAAGGAAGTVEGVDAAPLFEPSLWIGSGGSVSTAHFDLFDNVYCVVRGSKSFLLSPPRVRGAFGVYPGTHPHARQAQHHWNSSAWVAATAALPVMRADVRPGEALFIPSGWLHHVTAHTLTVALALTRNCPELARFNTWLTRDGALRPPGRWAVRRLAAALSVFLPTLLEHELGQPDLGLLRELVFGAYSAAVRDELGLAARAAQRFPCQAPSTEDAAWATAAARQVAERFHAEFRPAHVGLFLMPFLETVLGMLGGEMAHGLSFAQQCVLEPALAGTPTST